MPAPNDSVINQFYCWVQTLQLTRGFLSEPQWIKLEEEQFLFCQILSYTRQNTIIKNTGQDCDSLFLHTQDKPREKKKNHNHTKDTSDILEIFLDKPQPSRTARRSVKALLFSRVLEPCFQIWALDNVIWNTSWRDFHPWIHPSMNKVHTEWLDICLSKLSFSEKHKYRSL